MRLIFPPPGARHSSCGSSWGHVTQLPASASCESCDIIMSPPPETHVSPRTKGVSETQYCSVSSWQGRPSGQLMMLLITSADIRHPPGLVSHLASVTQAWLGLMMAMAQRDVSQGFLRLILQRMFPVTAMRPHHDSSWPHKYFDKDRQKPFGLDIFSGRECMYANVFL